MLFRSSRLLTITHAVCIKHKLFPFEKQTPGPKLSSPDVRACVPTGEAGTRGGPRKAQGPNESVGVCESQREREPLNERLKV